MNQRFRSRLFSFLTTLFIMVIIISGVAVWQYTVARAAVNQADVTDGLDVEIIAAPNFVVDSNVKSPSTYAPRVATVIGKFCNTGSATLTNVTGYIGDYDPTTPTPGTYPVRTADMTEHPHLDGSGDYSFTHLGNTSDATRYIGDLVPGQCSYQYWHFTYPACENVSGSPEEPACSLDPVWGTTNDYDDDLWLEFDVWGTSTGSGTTSDNETHTATMRNEISAQANKIEPNGNPGGRWFNTEASTVNPGETITTNGILYRLGNVNKGFDNNDDGVPDYNAWLQPFGDPSYDPSCFRLVETTGVLTVTTTSGDIIIPFKDNLYFSDLPPNNTNVVGEVYYEFLALGGVCTIPISPYQEAASGYDNEKFNGDYGSGPAPVQSFEPSVTIDKTGSPAAGAAGSRVDYTIGFENTSTQADAGLVLASGAGGTISLVISDTVPAGMTYIAGTAAANNVVPVGYIIRYYDTSTSGWTTTEPATAANVSAIQWWLNDPLERAGTGNNSGSVTFAASLPSSAPTPPFIENCAGGSFADADPFAESCTVTMISGSNTIGTYVWQDANSDGAQDEGTTAGITAVQVSLYYDKNGDGLLDSGDVLITTQDTSGVNDANYTFSNLPNGDFLVVVDDTDSDLPTGYGPTTATTFAVTGLTGSYTAADFGFGPILAMTKSLSSSDPAYEGENVTFTIDLENTRPGDGTGQGSACTYTVWASALDSANSGTGQAGWTNNINLYTPPGPDGVYSNAPYQGSAESVAVTNFSLGPQAGNIVTVEALVPIVVNPTLAGTLEVNIIDAANTYVHSYDAATLTSGTFVVGVSGDRSWAWDDFNGSTISIQLIARKSANPPGSLDGDAMGFRVTTDQTCGGADDTITLLPLSDEYDDTLFDFVSASPAPDSATTGVGTNYNPAGLLSWTNLGPLYAGQTKQVTVVLKALQPPHTDSPANGEPAPATTTNYASVTGATFANGNPVNDANDDDDVTIDPAGTIGDTIWNDNAGPTGTGTASDGIQNGDEAGIVNVTVYLDWWNSTSSTWVLTATLATDANGAYLFESLSDAQYRVRVDTTTLPGSTFTQTGDPDEAGACATCDSQTNAITLDNNDGNNTNDDYLSADFGYTIPNSIYGNVWEDNDGDATQDIGENGFNAITVYLDDCGANGACGDADDGATVSVTTDSDGNYSFEDLVDGNYRVRVDTSTLPGTGTWTQTVDPDATVDNQTVVISASGGNTYGAYDFAYTQTGSSSIGDTIYADWNGDGDQDTDEDGVSGVTVWLYEDSNGDGVIDPADDALIATTTTDANGEYTFSNLPAGDFIVVVDESDLPWDSYTQTEDYDSTLDGQAKVALPASTALDTVDFGYQPVGYGSIGDYIWQDADGDGLQDSGEAALGSIDVSLYVWEDDGDGVLESGEQGALISTTTSATDGSYLFGDLPAGDYIVDVDEADAPANHVVSSKYDHDDNLTTADINNDPMGVSLSDGENFLDADFGFAPGGTIGDYIWQDSNGNGEQDISESGINNVGVTLYNDVNGDGDYDSGTDTQYGSPTTTDATGYYAFTNLPAGDYVVVVTTPPANHTLTGDPDAYDANGTPYPPYDSSVTYTGLDGQYGTSLLGGHSDLTADFGYLPDGTIGDTLWLDFNADGVLDVGEPGVVGVDVYLDDGSCGPIPGTCALSTTDANGNYIFNSVANASYTVRVDTATLPTGLTQNYDPDAGNNCGGSCDNAGSVTIAGGSTDLTIDFGYIGTNSISGTVWHDDTDDTIIDGSETIRYEDVPIYLWDCGVDGTCGNTDDVYLGTTLTNSSGNYIFDNLPDGDYRVLVNPGVPILDGLAPTDTEGTPTTQHDVLNLAGGTDSTGNNFGFLSAIDYGDLPPAYERTLSSDNGARHVISSNLYLGSAQPDADADGQEDADAGGDDGDGNDDERGVTRQTGAGNPAHGGWTNGTVSDTQGGRLAITIGGTWSGIPQVFIDFDGDDTTYTLTEIILRDSSGIPLTMPLAAGTHDVYFDIPTGTFDGTTSPNPIFVRVRLSSSGGLGATGLASNGEVEDYKWNFSPTAITLQQFSARSQGLTTLGWLALIGALAAAGLSIFLRSRKPAAVNGKREE